eukprot:2063532-Heterocapsa_arctica.AAC.1
MPRTILRGDSESARAEGVSTGGHTCRARRTRGSNVIARRCDTSQVPQHGGRFNVGDRGATRHL